MLAKMENCNQNGFFPLTNLDSETFEKTINKLENFWKAKSIAYLDKFGLPTLQTIAITTWNEKIASELIKFCKDKGWNSVVIRTDKKAETGKDIPRGGYLVTLEQLDQEIKKIIELGRIVMILEPRDRYKNLYGINILYEKSSPDKLYFEIVGSGFEISNLNRGDIQPHERIMLKRVSSDVEILSHDIVSQSEYEQTVKFRFAQIGKSITPKDKTENLSDSELLEIGKDFLKRNEINLLEKNYQKIPIEYVKKMKDFVAELPHKLLKNNLEAEQFVLSATVFDSGELIFWDIVWPKHKYEGRKNG